MKPLNKLRVWWTPQIPGKPFQVEVFSLIEAKLLLDTLADYDQFQLDNRIKPDYCNAGGLEIDRGNGWEEWTPEFIDTSRCRGVGQDRDSIDDFTMEELRVARHETSEV